MESYYIRKKQAISEDALTASLGDFLEEFEEPSLLVKIIEKAKLVRQDGKLGAGNPEIPREFDRYELELWPRWLEGEPDMVIRFYSRDQIVSGVVIEAKYGASKSGEGVDEAGEIHDQLARYAKGMYRELSGKDQVIVIYLTGSSVPPYKELSDSWQMISEKVKGLSPGNSLAWLWWGDIDDVLSQLDDYESNPVNNRIKRVRELFRCANLKSFSGWEVFRTVLGLSEVPDCLWIGSVEKYQNPWDTAGSPAFRIELELMEAKKADWCRQKLKPGEESQYQGWQLKEEPPIEGSGRISKWVVLKNL